MAFTIKVNGTSHSVDVDGDTPLLWVLRDVLGMTGTKFGCGMALCGACTVHIDGTATRSCITSIDSIGDSQVTTIEGIGAPGNLHPMQAAFQDQHGLQCGFCTPGMIMAAIDLVKRSERLDERGVREGLEGNLCRCTGYHNIVRAVLQAAERM